MDIIYRFDPDHGRANPQPADCDEAHQRLLEGNRDFASFLQPDPTGRPRPPRVVPFDLRGVGIADRPGTAPSQAPFAVFLGCSDARVPIEIIFEQGCNDLFVVRVAGNVLGNECLGSIDYALDRFGDSLKLLVVLGHTGCGAVSAAVDAFLKPVNYLSLASSHALRSIVDRIFVAVRGSARALETVRGAGVEDAPGYRRALLETSVALNAAVTAYTLQQEERQFDRTGVRVLYGVYDLVQRRVGLMGAPAEPGHENDPQLLTPPPDQEGFVQLAARVAASEVVGRLLAGD